MYNPQNQYRPNQSLDPATVARGGMYGYGTDSGMGAGAPTSGAPTSGSGGMNPWEKAGIAGAGGLGALGLSSMFGGDEEEGVGGGANQYLSQIPDILKKYFAPYQKMLDPTSMMKQFGAGYTESPGYQFSLGQALKGVGSAAAAGGMAGSPMQQQQSAQTAQGMASQDYGQYMQRALGLYGQGAQGYRGLGEDLSSNLMSQAQLQQLQQEEEAKEREQESSDMWGAIGSIGGAAAKAIPW